MICGYFYPQMIETKPNALIRYNSWHLHKYRDGHSICLPCMYVLRNDNFRRKEVVAANNEIQYLQRRNPPDRNTLVDFIFYHPPAPPFVITIPADYRKHIMMQAVINYGISNFCIQFGEYPVWIELPAHRLLYETVKDCYEAGVGTKDILHHIPGGKAVREAGNEQTRRDEIIAPYRPSPLLQLIVELTKPNGTQGW